MICQVYFHLVSLDPDLSEQTDIMSEGNLAQRCFGGHHNTVLSAISLVGCCGILSIYQHQQ